MTDAAYDRHSSWGAEGEGRGSRARYGHDQATGWADAAINEYLGRVRVRADERREPVGSAGGVFEEIDRAMTKWCWAGWWALGVVACMISWLTAAKVLGWW